MEQNYKDIVIQQLAYRVSDLEGYANRLIAENTQLRNELSEATMNQENNNVVDFPNGEQ